MNNISLSFRDANVVYLTKLFAVWSIDLVELIMDVLKCCWSCVQKRVGLLENAARVEKSRKGCSPGGKVAVAVRKNICSDNCMTSVYSY